MTSPWAPIVAMNANASMTPPNWAKTLLAESTRDRPKPPGREPRSAKHRAAPAIAPTTAVTAESQKAPKNEPAMAGSARPLRLAQVNRPSPSTKPLPTATSVGTARKITT